jgi:hypothetical protein
MRVVHVFDDEMLLVLVGQSCWLINCVGAWLREEAICERRVQGCAPLSASFSSRTHLPACLQVCW